MKKKCFLLLFMFTAYLSFAQKSVMEFTPAQRTALKSYLNANPLVGFESEGYFNGNGNQKIAKEWFGQDFTPYYNFNDLNGDGKRDFAVLLSKGRSKQVLLIFNSYDNKSYKLAFKKEYDDHQSAFINRSSRWSDNNL